MRFFSENSLQSDRNSTTEKSDYSALPVEVRNALERWMSKPESQTPLDLLRITILVVPAQDMPSTDLYKAIRIFFANLKRAVIDMPCRRAGIKSFP
jgi:hypothetical protein